MLPFKYFNLLSLVLLVSTIGASAQSLDKDTIAHLKARSIGPAGMSGRVTSIDVVLSDPDVMYVGTASGGLWRSVNGGTTWKPIFDDQPAASIGAVAVNQANPDIIWVGTGEGNPRNSQTGGTGMYKSIDGGRSWQFLGLGESRSIHRIILHPDHEDWAWVGVQGSAWGDSPERGVFRTVDGGKTWQKVLYVNERTGIADLVVDPSNPNKLIAAMWEFRRHPWFFNSGGEGSGLYVTYDGGDHWTQKTSEQGLPEGELGRIGLAIAPSNPNIVYALVESKKTGFYRSDDGGDTWKRLSEKDIGDRPFYYADIYVDPLNENRVWSIYGDISKSEDGGKSFEQVIKYTGQGLHPDHHAWWIHPANPDFIMEGNDGGLNISRDRGKTWTFVESLPLAQFYHIDYDMDRPYHVYGGMQDNGSWRGPSSVWRAGGIRNAYWEEVDFGDGFDVVPDPTNSRYGWAMSQGGHVNRYDVLTGAKKFVRPTHPDKAVLRFNWNAGMAIDPFDPSTIYFGSQYLHRSRDRGDTWEIISPDLTTNDPSKQHQLDSGGLTYDVTEAENFTTIISIAPSPIARDLIWVGTDDGNLQLTRDGGTSWTNVRKNVHGVPDSTWIPQIRPSSYDAGTAFVVFDDHRRNNWTPYVYRTTDYGATWTSLVDGGDIDGYALSFIQDPTEPNLMFIGAELGLFVSIDGGATWTKWTAGYPTVSTMDLAIQPRDGDLVIGTFGRGAYILDDLEPLRALARSGAGLLSEPVHVFKPTDAFLAQLKRAAGTRFAADFMFAGKNRDVGALLTYSLSGDPGETVENDEDSDSLKAKKHAVIDIFDADGDLINSIKGPVEKGFNRVTWKLNRKALRLPDKERPSPDTLLPNGASVIPGEYGIRVSYNGHTDSTSVTVLPDPRLDVSQQDVAAGEKLRKEYESLVRAATQATDRIRDAKKTLHHIGDLLTDRTDDAAQELKTRSKTVQDSLDVLLSIFVDKKVQGIRSDPMNVNNRLSEVNSYLSSTPGAPGQGAEVALRHARERLQEGLDAINEFFSTEWNAYRLGVEDAQITLFKDQAPLKIE
jgi:photosystem II stability/assembly factor-like uncharacterized protein